MKSRGLAILFCITAVTLAACSMAQITPTKDPQIQEHLGTAVAGTLTASVGTITRTLPPATPEPSDTPTIAPTHEPGPLKVVYSRAGSIWIWEEGGSKKQLTNNIVDFRPRLSDDGSLVVFERNNELYMINSDGSNLHALVNDAFLKDYIPTGLKFIWAEYFDWMPNTHYVYFTTKAGISGPETDIFLYDLFRADADTGEVKQIVAPGSGGVPYFSADGKTIAMAQPNAIYLATPSGIGIRKALAFDPVAISAHGFNYFPILRSLLDGSGFRMFNFKNNPNGSGEIGNLWNIPVLGEATLIDSGAQGFFNIYSLSPNGNSIGYVTGDSSGSQVCLKTIMSATKSVQDYCVTRTINMPGMFLNFSPQGRHFVYYAPGSPTEKIFYLGSPDGTDTVVDTYEIMDWVNEEEFIYVSQENDIYVAFSNGKQEWIDKGISRQELKTSHWYWQFDLSN